MLKEPLDKLLTIDIWGQTFNFKTEQENVEAQAVADFLSEQVTRVEGQIAGKSSSVSKKGILLMTALNITNEYLELKKRYADLLEEISNRSTILISTIENRRSAKSNGPD